LPGRDMTRRKLALHRMTTAQFHEQFPDEDGVILSPIR
jgi:hypothetical protein